MSTATHTLRRLALSATIVTGGFSFASAACADTPITIVNNLDQPLVFEEIKNRQSVKIKSDPPAEILAHSSGTFKIAVGSAGKDEHLNIKYAIKDSDGQIGVVYKYNKLEGGTKHCPKEHPDWVSESVKNCGDYDSKKWTYTFSPAAAE